MGLIELANRLKSYVLMHKNTPVAGVDLDGATGTISAVGHVFHENHVPVGINIKKGLIDRTGLNEWWRGRAIPASRAGINNALLELRLPDTQLLLEKCLGLSLSDQYWICPAGSKLNWGKINFFENPFSEDMGNILFGRGSSNSKISLMSPDNTSDGWLKKKWKVIDGKRCLIKGGSGATQQEPYNEVFASRIMERLGIPHVPYSLLVEDNYPYSACGNFITPDTELISAWYIMHTAKKENHTSVYQHYVNCCDRLGVPGIRQALDQMIVLDYLIVNEDRHQNNFGVIRHAETLEFIGAAPIYDSGTSLWFDKPNALINRSLKTVCKPFKNNHEEQIKLVSSFDWIDFTALTDIEEELREIVQDSLFIDSVRCDALCLGIKNRVELLREAAKNHGKQFFVDTPVSDVTENTAYSASE